MTYTFIEKKINLFFFSGLKPEGYVLVTFSVSIKNKVMIYSILYQLPHMVNRIHFNPLLYPSVCSPVSLFRQSDLIKGCKEK